MNQLEQNKQLVRRFLDGISQWDADLLRSLTNPDFSVVLPSQSGLPGTIAGKQFYDLVDVFKRVVPKGITFDVIEYTAEQDRVATAVEGTSTMFDGRSYNNRYHMLDYVRDGKIVKHVEYMDSYLAATVLVPGFEHFGFRRA